MLSDEEREALQYFNTETKTEAMHYGAVLVKLIEKQSKEIEELHSQIDEHVYNGCDYELCNKKWEDKIKAKIEEVDKDENASIPDFIEYAKEYAHEKLQSLLEKE